MSRNWWVLIAVACGTFMATLDSSVVNVALPTLTRKFSTDLGHIKWVVTIYFLIITCLLLPIGKISDHFGHKRVFTFGFIAFTFGSLLCGIAPSLEFLIFSRVIQAFGAAMLMANGPAIITSTFPAKRLGTALGFLAMSVSVGLISGPALGGLLIVDLGWRSIFLINIPIGLTGIYLVHRFVKPDLLRRKKFRFDWPGAILQSAIIILFYEVLDTLEVSHSYAPVSRTVVFFFILGLIYLFIQVEKKSRYPLVDLALVKITTFWTANLSGFLMFVSYFSVAILTPFFLEEILKVSTDGTGRMMSAIPIVMLFSAPLAGRLSDHLGSRGLCVFGTLIAALTFLSIGGAIGPGFTQNTKTIWVVAALCFTGFAIGVFQSPNNNAIMGVVPKAKLGTASALIATIRNLGLVTGAGLATGLFSWQHRVTQDFMVALRFTFVISGVIAVIAMVASLGKAKGPHWMK